MTDDRQCTRINSTMIRTSTANERINEDGELSASQIECTELEAPKKSKSIILF